MVQISKGEKTRILYSLLMDGVITIKKEFDTNHPELDIANIKIWVMLRKMKCQNYVTLTYNWRHYYYTLNSEGIKNVKELLGITEAKVQPNTRKNPIIEAEPVEEEKTEGGRRRKEE